MNRETRLRQNKPQVDWIDCALVTIVKVTEKPQRKAGVPATFALCFQVQPYNLA
jgi:hypothetical protein